MLANSEYFISSQPDNKQLILFNNNNYEIIRRISNIDSLNSTDALLKVNEMAASRNIKSLKLFSPMFQHEKSTFFYNSIWLNLNHLKYL